ncbi:hypothetical protein Taro_028466 [Colocasia esculenta]|uniref:LysM domain-containing protein n=1 Tax=Colocasia esculenta TaxID=4460 RepID=A0A843VRY1_COLES|nr:hypothetical protein [Colocasia esculenta]
MRSDVRWDARRLTHVLMMGHVVRGCYNRGVGQKICSAPFGHTFRAGDPHGGIERAVRTECGPTWCVPRRSEPSSPSPHASSSPRPRRQPHRRAVGRCVLELVPTLLLLTLLLATRPSAQKHQPASMGCCGDDEDDQIRQLLCETLVQTSSPSSSSPSSPADSDAAGVISPMNSNFSALVSCRDVLRAILELLPPADLARAACVCRIWSEIASEREVQERGFRSPWKVACILGDPSSSGFWRHPSLGRFAISHRIVRGDTVVGLAVKYSVQVMDIKRLNNMMSDHGIYSRERLLIPIGNPDILCNSTCYIEMDAYAKREVAVLYLEGRSAKVSYLANRTVTERGKRKILDSVRRSLQVDDGTAGYYLSISNGDPRAALSEFSEDLKWEQQRAH